jgi:hypothetical protein
MGLPHPNRRGPSEGDKPRLGDCLHCGSAFVQPQGWKELPGGDFKLHLRCPECQALTTGRYDQQRVAAYDEALVSGREAIVASYEAMVRKNMESLVERFVLALEHDLIGPEDFATPALARR